MKLEVVLNIYTLASKPHVSKHYIPYQVMTIITIIITMTIIIMMWYKVD